MLVIPAIDLRGGKCVRLSQGRADAQTVFSEQPTAVAATFAAAGAQLIHVVDLDGAFAGSPQNLGVIEAIAQVGVPLEVGGGVRNQAALEAVFKAGAARVILGTTAISDPDFVQAACKAYPGRIFVGIDAREGQVATKGWVETAAVTATDLARTLGAWGVAGLIYTDISRDGMLTGPNLEALAEIAAATPLPVIASGGISRLEDLKAIAALTQQGLNIYGAIVGKAIYTGAIDLAAAIAAIGK